MGDSLIAVSDDGIARCSWVGTDPLYRAYHDQEWGREVRGEQPLFERICLEAFQSGLAWITILRKRPAFRRAFADFDPEVVADFTDADIARLMDDADIVRNRRKIDATITNARATLALRADGGLDQLVWAHAPAARRTAITAADIPTRTSQSLALAKALKKAGFAHVGPTTMYAVMQACGLVDDHVAGCHRAPRA